MSKSARMELEARGPDIKTEIEMKRLQSGMLNNNNDYPYLEHYLKNTLHGAKRQVTLKKEKKE